jgi:hypothetical protein
LTASCARTHKNPLQGAEFGAFPAPFFCERQRQSAVILTESTAEPKREPEDTSPEVAEDRRARVRYPIEMPFSYRTLDRTFRRGVGRILNISSRGILAECTDKLSADTSVELTIEWPLRLDGAIPLHLVIAGTIVRCEKSRFAVAASQHRLLRADRHPAATTGGPISDEGSDTFELAGVSGLAPEVWAWPH